MNCIQLVQYVSWTLCFCVFGRGQIEKTKSGLALTKQNNEFKLALTIPEDYNSETKIANFKSPTDETTYLFCKPVSNLLEKSYLQEREEIKPGTQFNDENKCEVSADAVFVKVTNPDKFKNIAWNHDNMELYHSGYMLMPNNMSQKVQNRHTFSATKPIYDGWDSYFEFLVQIEAYFNKKMERIVAVQYTLLSTNLLDYNQSVVDKEKIISSGKTGLKIANIFTRADSLDYLQIFDDRITQHLKKILTEQREYNGLTTILMASNVHFPLPLWKQPSLLDFNLLPIWEKPKKMWNRVQEFAKIVAKHFGDLKVTVGITDTMTLSNQKVVDKDGFQFPKYLWNVYELRKENQEYGIIVVINFNSFEKIETKICEVDVCTTYGWLIANNDYLTGEIYCCEMTARNVEQLEANFLLLKEKRGFDLHKWSENSEKIGLDYKHYVLAKEDEINDDQTH